MLPTSDLTLSSTIRLPSGTSMPLLGYGVYQTPRDICTSVVHHALQTGYRHIDSARAYRNEQACAEGMQLSGQPRSSIFFTSKIGPRDMGYPKTVAAIDASLAATGLDYLDLLLVHAPYGGKEARCGTWRALREAQKRGRVRAIGVSNYGVHHLDELKEYIDSDAVGDWGQIDVGQWELHPWLPREDIVRWARENGVVVQAWSPLVRGQRRDEAVLREIGEKHGRTWAQVLLRWSLQMGFVPLPKSVTPARIEENADVFGFKLDDEDMERLRFPGSYAPCSWDPTVSHD